MTIAAGCRSGAVVFPCLGRGMCLRSGHCKCSDGYLGTQCHVGCPGLADDDGLISYCSGRGNCSAVTLSSAAPPKGQEEAAREGSLSQTGDRDVELGMCTCQYGYFGRLCDRECPGGAASACSDSGRCLDNGDCECWSGYGGDKCQFKNKEVQNFGSMAALSIVLSMLVVTVLLVMGILLKKAVARRMEQRSYRTMHNMDEEDLRDSGAQGASNGDCSRSADDGMSHPLLDAMADKMLDCLPRLPRWLALPHASGSVQMTSSPSSRGNLQAPRKTLHP